MHRNCGKNEWSTHRYVARRRRHRPDLQHLRLQTDDAQVSTSSIYANTYIRDNLGRITEKTETIQGTTTVYDYHYEPLVGRLEQVDETVGFVTTARVYMFGAIPGSSPASAALSYRSSKGSPA